MMLGELVVAVTLLGSVQAAIDKTVPPDAPLYTKQLERRVFVTETENEATRVIADGTAADILSGGFDIATTGWGRANGAAESNFLLGGNKTNALIIIGVKAGLLATTYFARRHMMSEWKACVLRRYDGSAEECGQRDTVQNATKWVTIVRTILGGSNAVIAWRQPQAAAVP